MIHHLTNIVQNVQARRVGAIRSWAGDGPNSVGLEQAPDKALARMAEYSITEMGSAEGRTDRVPKKVR